MKKLIVSLVAITLLMTTAVFADSFSGTVMSVIDGNNIVMTRGDKLVKVRLAGIGCPELEQDYGMQAKQFVTDMIMGREVKVDIVTVDHEKRMVCSVFSGSRDVGLEVAAAGLAWCDMKYIHSPRIATAVAEVKAKHNGIWSKANPVSPWMFRQKKLGIRPVMSTTITVISASNYGWQPSSNSGYMAKEATTPPAGWGADPRCGASPAACSPASTPPANVSPASSQGPGCMAPGSGPMKSGF